MTTPIRISATLAEPVVWYGDGMHLDSILAAAVLRELHEDGRGDELEDIQTVDWPRDFDLPLATWTAPISGKCDARLLDDDGQVWGWRASDAHPQEPIVESSHAVRKMVDVDDLVEHTDASTYKTNQGALKPADKTYPTIHCPELVWWAVTGGRDRVSHLLNRYVSHLGKLRGHGLGRVQRWSIDKVDEDYSMARAGETTRALPASAIEADQASRPATIRPPYWHPTREVSKAYPAGTEVFGEVV